jgi:hypothetical protein
MRAIQLKTPRDLSEIDLLESVGSPVLYHWTSMHSAQQIMNSGQFRLSTTAGSDFEQKLGREDRPYFLSTSRSRVGDYHRYVGAGGVMFVLDADWLRSRYLVKPVDYWERSWAHAPGRTREAEDRVLSTKSTIPIDPVREIHALLTEPDPNRSPRLRQIALAAKLKKIPIWIYDNPDAWRLQDRRRALPTEAWQGLLGGAEPVSRHWSSPRGHPTDGWGRSDLLNWIELIKKQPGQPLGPAAERLRYNLVYHGDHSASLKNALSNARKPERVDYAQAVTLTDYLRRNRMTLADLNSALKAKWRQPR